MGTIYIQPTRVFISIEQRLLRDRSLQILRSEGAEKREEAEREVGMGDERGKEEDRRQKERKGGKGMHLSMWSCGDHTP